MEALFLGEALDEDRAGAVQGRLHVGDGVAEVVVRRRGRVVARGGEQQVREGLQAVLAGDLRIGPAPGLVRQVQVLEAGLGVGGVDPFCELGGELSLLRDRRQDRGAPLLELAQVAQALLQRSELGVVQRAGGFLAVPRDERNGGAAVEQLDGGGDLAVADAEFRGDPPDHSGPSHGCEPSGRGKPRAEGQGLSARPRRGMLFGNARKRNNLRGAPGTGGGMMTKGKLAAMGAAALGALIGCVAAVSAVRGRGERGAYRERGGRELPMGDLGGTH